MAMHPHFHTNETYSKPSHFRQNLQIRELQSLGNVLMVARYLVTMPRRSGSAKGERLPRKSG